jgi:cytochrome c-type biogenesis protein
MDLSVSVPAAFAAGLLSFASPCVLPLVPAYISYISGVSVEEMMSPQSVPAVRRIGLMSLFFVLGFSAVFIAMGAAATSIGRLLIDKIDVLMMVAGIIIVVFGLHMIGVFRINILYSDRRIRVRPHGLGFLGAVIIGMTFAFGWTPCIGPALATILTMAADSDTVLRGMLLLTAYSLGLGIPFLVAGFAIGGIIKAMGKLKRHFRKIEVASGILMVAIGMLIFLGRLQDPLSILRFLPGLR